MSSALEHISQSYMPLFSGVPFTPSTGFEGLLPAGTNPMLQIAAQMLGSSLMGRVGMSPMGFSDRNIYDTMQARRFYELQQEAMKATAEIDRQGWMDTSRGLAHMFGTPWGDPQIAAAKRLTDLGVAAAPTMASMMPDLLDDIAGPRGSATVLAQRMMMAGRYRFDPVSGRIGQYDPKMIAQQATSLFQDVFAEGDLSKTQGFSAGQYGLAYEQLAARGLIAGARPPGDMMRRLYGTDRALIAEAGGRQGFQSLPLDAKDFSADQLHKLSADPMVADKLRGLDTDRVKASLSGYLAAINAVRDIFGENGEPNAPMAKLVGALAALTNNSLSQIQPGQLNMMVRMTHQLAQSSGMGMDSAMIMQQHASAQAVRMGLEPIFGIGATQAGMAHGMAYKAMGLPPAWGAMSPDEYAQLQSHLNVGAAGSQAAQRMGLALRLNKYAGFGRATNLDPNKPDVDDLTTNAGRYVAALKSAQDTGATTWTDMSGKQQPLNMAPAEYTRLLVSGGQSAENVQQMLSHNFANRELLTEFGIPGVVKRDQRRSDLTPRLQDTLVGFLQGQLLQSGLGQPEAHAAAIQAAGTAAGEIMDIDSADFRSAKRHTLTAEILKRSLAGTAGAGRLDTRQLALNFAGAWDQSIRNDPEISGLQNSIRYHDAGNDEINNAVSRVMIDQRLDARLRTTLAPLNRGGALRRAMGYLQDLGNKPQGKTDTDLWKLALTAMGAEEHGKLRGELEPYIVKHTKSQERLKDLREKISAADPNDVAKLADQYTEEEAALQKHIEKILDITGKHGVSDDMLSITDTQRALKLGDQEMEGGKALAEYLKKDKDNTYESYMATPEGKDYADIVRRHGAAAGDVAMRMMASKESVRMLGLEGIEQATNIKLAERELLSLAGTHTGGDMAMLMSGEGKLSKMSKEQREGIMRDVEKYSKARRTAEQAIHDMRAGKMPVWDIDKTAAELKASREAVILARDLPGNIADMAIRAMVKDSDPVRQARREKALLEAYRESGGKDDVTAEQLMAAGGVRSRMDDRIRKAAQSWTGSDEDVARSFLDHFGVVSENEEQLKKLGVTLRGSPVSEAIGMGLTDSRDRIKAAGTATGRSADDLIEQYRKVKKDPGALRSFLDAHGVEEKDFARLDKSGFWKFGEFGEQDAGEASKLLSEQINTGKIGGDEVSISNWPEKFTAVLDGKLTVDGRASGTAEVSSEGLAHAPTSGGEAA